MALDYPLPLPIRLNPQGGPRNSWQQRQEVEEAAAAQGLVQVGSTACVLLADNPGGLLTKGV